MRQFLLCFSSSTRIFRDPLNFANILTKVINMKVIIPQNFISLQQVTFIILHRILIPVFVLAFFWIIAMILKNFILKLARKNLQKSYVFKILADFCKISLILLGIVTALGTAGLNVSAIVASLGLSGFALGFALKDYLSNILAGITILMYQPFQINDNIQVTSAEGKVAEINLRYTILVNDQKRILIPNSTMLNNTINILNTS